MTALGACSRSLATFSPVFYFLFGRRLRTEWPHCSISLVSRKQLPIHCKQVGYLHLYVGMQALTARESFLSARELENQIAGGIFDVHVDPLGYR